MKWNTMTHLWWPCGTSFFFFFFVLRGHRFEIGATFSYWMPTPNPSKLAFDFPYPVGTVSI
jgi:hypothetical protein